MTRPATRTFGPLPCSVPSTHNSRTGPMNCRPTNRWPQGSSPRAASLSSLARRSASYLSIASDMGCEILVVWGFESIASEQVTQSSLPTPSPQGHRIDDLPDLAIVLLRGKHVRPLLFIPFDLNRQERQIHN